MSAFYLEGLAVRSAVEKKVGDFWWKSCNNVGRARRQIEKRESRFENTLLTKKKKKRETKINPKTKD